MLDLEYSVAVWEVTVESWEDHLIVWDPRDKLLLRTPLEVQTVTNSWSSEAKEFLVSTAQSQNHVGIVFSHPNPSVSFVLYKLVCVCLWEKELCARRESLQNSQLRPYSHPPLWVQQSQNYDHVFRDILFFWEYPDTLSRQTRLFNFPK